MFFILHSLFFIIYNFALKSAYTKLTKNKKNFRPTDPNIFRHVSGNTGIFLGLMTILKVIAQFYLTLDAGVMRL